MHAALFLFIEKNTSGGCCLARSIHSLEHYKCCTIDDMPEYTPTDKKKLYSEITKLNQSISTLALKVSAKEKELIREKKLYDEKLDRLNVYFEQIRKLLEINTSTEGEIQPEEVLDAQEKVSKEYPNMIVIPKLSLRRKLTDKLISNKTYEDDSENTQKPAYTDLKEKYQVKHAVQNKKKGRKHKKITCSYCKKVGHKRAECPEIYLIE